MGDMQRDSRDTAVSEPRSFPNPPDFLAKVGGYREKPVTSKGTMRAVGAAVFSGREAYGSFHLRADMTSR